MDRTTERENQIQMFKYGIAFIAFVFAAFVTYWGWTTQMDLNQKVCGNLTQIYGKDDDHWGIYDFGEYGTRDIYIYQRDYLKYEQVGEKAIMKECRNVSSLTRSLGKELASLTICVISIIGGIMYYLHMFYDK